MIVQTAPNQCITSGGLLFIYGFYQQIAPGEHVRMDRLAPMAGDILEHHHSRLIAHAS
jgi:hypothetical protein